MGETKLHFLKFLRKAKTAKIDCNFFLKKKAGKSNLTFNFGRDFYVITNLIFAYKNLIFFNITNIIKLKNQTIAKTTLNFYFSYILFNGLKKFFYKLIFDLKVVSSKYNNPKSYLTSLNFYVNITKYYPIFSESTDQLVLSKNIVYNFLPVYHEITDIKVDKSKKIFFKKKQIKTFTFLNELLKKKVYVEMDGFEEKDLFKKFVFTKNIFSNINFLPKHQNVIINEGSLIANKSLLFWKKTKPSVNFKKISLILIDYVVNKYGTKHVRLLSVLSSDTFENSFFTVDTEQSHATFSYLNKNVKDNAFKKIFLYNFIKIFKKAIDINYTQQYSYLTHSKEFKDYFYEKNNVLSKDVDVLSNNNKNKFNNFFPLYCLSSRRFKKLILFSKKQQSPSYSSYYMYYLISFLETICKQKVWVRVNTKKQVSDDVYIKFMELFVKNRADQVNIGKHFFLIEFYEIIYLSFINRDITFFAMWFKKIMEKIHLKKHRKVVKVIHSTIRNNKLFLELTGVKGFSMDVRGKLGTAGNSKKKHYAFAVGSIAPTTKSHGLNLSQTTVRTSTGVLGVTILMSY